MCKVYERVAQIGLALERCVEAGLPYAVTHKENLKKIMDEHLPSGAGFTATELVDVKPDKLTFEVNYHHMDEWGGYDGWTNHNIIVRPRLDLGFEIRVTGRNKNDIKDYIAEVFSESLSKEI